jgi:putative endonuclease
LITFADGSYLVGATIRKVMAEHNDFGNLAEDLAVDFLAQKNYKILGRNYRYQRTEIDIIAEFDGLIIIVEVKARGSDFFMEPQEAVNKCKIKSIVKCADFYLQINNIDKEVRFDIITVVPDEKKKLQITHIEDAFQSFDAN